MAQKQWLNLEMYGMRAGVLNSDTSPVFSVFADAPKHQEMLLNLGFKESDFDSVYSTSLSVPEAARLLRTRFPNIKVSSYDANDIIFRDEEMSTRMSVPSEQEEPLHRGTEITEDMDLETMRKHSRFLGINSMGYHVFDNNGRRFIMSEHGLGKAIFENSTMMGGTFLRATDEKSLHSSCDGFVKSLENGKVSRFSDLVNFVSALYDRNILETDPRLRGILPYIDASITRVASKTQSVLIDNFKKMQRYNESMAFLGDIYRKDGDIETASLPLSLILHRAIGLEDLKGKNVEFRGFSTLSSFSFFPKGIKIKSVMEDTAPNFETIVSAIGKRADISLTSSPSNDTDILVMKTQYQEGEVKSYGDYAVSRTDFQKAIESLETRSDDGRSLYAFDVMGEDAAFRKFLSYLVKHYYVEGVAQIDGQVSYQALTASDVALVSVGQRRPENTPIPDVEGLITVCESYDDAWSWTLNLSNTRAKLLAYHTGLVGTTLSDEEIEVLEERNRLQVPYKPMSSLGQPRTMISRNLEASLRHAQKKILAAHPHIDSWVANELQMSLEELESRFSPEQIDSIGMAIFREETGEAGFLLSDQMGVGKGRILAALMWRSVLLGRKALFLTERTINMSDIVRDMRNIGVLEKIGPVILNNDVVLYDNVTNDVVMTSMPREELDALFKNDEWPEGMPVMIATYSLFNKYGGELKTYEVSKRDEKGDFLIENGKRVYETIVEEDNRGPKSLWLRALFERHSDITLFSDECHTVSNIHSNTGGNINFARERALFTCYSSATYNKDSESLPYYASLLPRYMDMDDVQRVMREGGDSFQEVFSSMLVRSGAMMGRQLNLRNLTFETVEDTQNRDKHKMHMDALSPVLQKIALLSGDVSKDAKIFNQSMVESLRHNGDNEDDIKEKMKSIRLSTASFGSPLYMMTRLFLCSLLIDCAAQQAIDCLKNNQKPVILLENTVQGILEDIAKEQRELLAEGKTEDDVRRTIDFKDLMYRSLKQLTTGRVLNRDKKGFSTIDHSDINLDVEALYDAADLFLPMIPEAIRLADETSQDAHYQMTESEIVKSNALLKDTLERSLEELKGKGVYSTKNLNAARKGMTRIIETLPANPVIRALRLRQLTTSLPVNFYRQIQSIKADIAAMPDLPLSAIDAIRERIEAAGYSCGEITGRSSYVDNGIVRPRKKVDKAQIKNMFNAGEIDALIVNRQASTGIDLHASATFKNQCQRVLIELQILSQITSRVQAFGRVNRYDEVVGPIIRSLVTKMPMELRLLTMSNTKLRQLSANISSNRDHAALIGDIPDLMNSVGDTVIHKYFEARPEMLRYLGFSQDDITKMMGKVTDVIDVQPVDEDNGTDEFKATTDSISETQRDNARWANMVLPRLALLPTDWQSQVIDELDMLYKATIEELDALGKNPLKQKEITGKVHIRSRELYDGIDDPNANEFDRAVWKQRIVIERVVEPIRSNTLMMMVESGQHAALREQNMEDTALYLERNITSLLSPFVPLEFSSLEDALNNDGPKTLKDQYDRLHRIIEMLRTIKPGHEVTLMMDGEPNTAIVTEISLSQKRSMHLPSAYRLTFVAPGMDKPKTVSFHSLLSDPSFCVNEGLNGEHEDAILKKFEETLQGSRLETRTVFTGNEYKAMLIAVNNNIGNMTMFQDQNGVMHRGVLVHKKFNDNLDFIPVETIDKNLIHTYLTQGPNKKETRRAFLTPERKNRLCIQGQSAGAMFYLPGVKSTLFKRIQTTHVFNDLINKLPEPPKTSAKIFVPEHKLSEALDALISVGQKLYLSAKDRAWVSDYRTTIFSKERALIDDDTHESSPKMGR